MEMGNCPVCGPRLLYLSAESEEVYDSGTEKSYGFMFAGLEKNRDRRSEFRKSLISCCEILWFKGLYEVVRFAKTKR